MYAQMLVGMVGTTGQWWLDARKPAKDVVAAHLVNLAWNGLSGLEQRPAPAHRVAAQPFESERPADVAPRGDTVPVQPELGCQPVGDGRLLHEDEGLGRERLCPPRDRGP